jgi:hypothetical protein
MEMSIGQRKILQDLNDYWDYARNNRLRQKWLDRYRRNLRFYCGEHWDTSVLTHLENIKATPYTVNRIEPLVNAYSSLQIQSNKRIGFKSTTNSTLHEQLADDMSDLAHVIQTQNDSPFYSSLKYTDALIGGVGYSHFCYEDGNFFYDRISPFEIWGDPDDSSPRYEKGNFICRSYFAPVIALKKRYPKFASYFESLVSQSNISDCSFNTSDLNDIANDTAMWSMGRSVRIVEIYYKESSDYFQTNALPSDEENESLSTEYSFDTFNEEFAIQKSSNGIIHKRKGTRIFKGAFTDGILLEHGAIVEQVPNQKYFPILPLCLKRDHEGVPYGVVDNLISLSKALNYVWTKTIHGIDQKILISSNINQDIEATEEKWIEKLQQKIAVIISANPSDAKLYTPEQTLPYFFNLLNRLDVEFEQSTYLFDELKGNQTNAVSGVAIQQRAVNSARVQNPLNMAYDHMLLSEGQLLLDTVKGIKDFNYTFNHSQDGKTNLRTLDSMISAVNFEVYADVVPNFSSSIEEERAKFAELLNSNNPAFAMSSPLFLKELGFRKYNELSEEYIKLISGQKQEASTETSQ